MSKNIARQYSKDEAIRLHATAHKSDPFAAKRIAMAIRSPKDAAHHGKEAALIVNLRKHDQNVFCAFFNSLEGHTLHMAIKDAHPVKKPRKYVRKADRTERQERIAA